MLALAADGGSGSSKSSRSSAGVGDCLRFCARPGPLSSASMELVGFGLLLFCFLRRLIELLMIAGIGEEEDFVLFFFEKDRYY